MSNKPAPRCPGCGKEMKSTGFPEGGWWYRCSCGWKSPADEWSEDGAYERAMKRYEPVRRDGYQGTTHEQGWPDQRVQTLHGGGEVHFDMPPGKYPLVCESTREADPQRKAVFTVAIKDLECEEMDIWTSAFSTRELAEEFMRAVRRKLAAYGVTTVQVCLDSGDLDGDVYLSWLDDRYGGEDDD